MKLKWIIWHPTFRILILPNHPSSNCPFCYFGPSYLTFMVKINLKLCNQDGEWVIRQSAILWRLSSGRKDTTTSRQISSKICDQKTKPNCPSVDRWSYPLCGYKPNQIFWTSEQVQILDEINFWRKLGISFYNSLCRKMVVSFCAVFLKLSQI